jgi:hypothetical protein
VEVEARKHYYAGSSLIWLDGGQDSERAAHEAAQAIDLWQQALPKMRSLDDEALAHVYQASAHLQLGQLDAAAVAIRPIQDLPACRQTSWIHKRLGRFANMLRKPRYQHTREAADLYDEIQTFAL